MQDKLIFILIIKVRSWLVEHGTCNLGYSVVPLELEFLDLFVNL